jgi:O-antigen ligase
VPIVSSARTAISTGIGSVSSEWNLTRLPPFLFGVVVVAWIASDKGGYYASSWSWVALTGLGLATFVLILVRTISLGRLDLLLLGSFAGFTAWTLASVAWSDSVPSTLDAATRCLAYLALVTAAVLVTRPSTSRNLLGGAFTGATLVCLYSLATRLLPDRVGTFDSVAGGYRLSTPITYWNGLGVFAVMALFLAFTFAARSRRTVLRAGAAATLPLLAATVYFTFSRGAWLALGAGMVVAVATDRRRLQLTAVGALLAAPTAVAVWLSSGPAALRVERSSLAAASIAGHRLLEELLALALASALGGAVAHLLEQRVTLPPLVRRGWAALLVLAVAGSIALSWAKKGSPIHEARVIWTDFHHAPNAGRNVGSRLFNLSSNGRLDLWHVAWRTSRRAPLGGHGGGTFWQAWAADPTHAFVAKDAHNLYLQTLNETGVVGLGVLLIALLTPVAAALRTRGRLTAGALAAYSAWLVHGAVDWDWQLLGVSALAVVVGVALVVRSRTAARPLRSITRWPLAAASTVLAAVAFSTVMANVSLDRAVNAYAHRRLATADRYTSRAEAWNPWSAGPWDLRASIAAQRGDASVARKDMRAALKRDPRNWQLELRLALVSTGAVRNAAFAAARRLDPHDVPKTIPPSLVRKRAPRR